MLISKNRIIVLFTILCIFSTVSPVHSGSYLYPESKKLPSTLEARLKLKDLILDPDIGDADIVPDVIIDRIEEQLINFFSEKSSGRISLYFSLDSGLDFTRVKKGSCEIIKTRSGESWEISSIRFYIKDDPDSYVSIYPDPDSGLSFMRIYLYGFLMQKDIKVPISIADASISSFVTIEKLTSAYVDWRFYLPDPMYIYSDDVIRLSNRIMPLLKFLKDTDDGAMDKNGRYVYIDTLEPQEGEGGLNCSGFAKWVVDGIYHLKTDSYIDINVLKQKNETLRGSRWTRKIEDKYDPFFGLDWTRNLARQMDLVTNPDVLPGTEDVRDLRFHSYTENVGYPLKDLKTIMYELAVTSPSYFYLGSINMITDIPEGFRKHLHVVVIFPYIDSSGEFSNIILSRNKRISEKELEQAYPDAFIHLVRVKADPRFTPPGLKFDPTIRRF